MEYWRLCCLLAFVPKYKPQQWTSTDVLEEISKANAVHFPVSTRHVVNCQSSFGLGWSRSGLPEHTTADFLPALVVPLIVMITTAVLVLSIMKDGLTSVLLRTLALMARFKPSLASFQYKTFHIL